MHVNCRFLLADLGHWNFFLRVQKYSLVAIAELIIFLMLSFRSCYRLELVTGALQKYRNIIRQKSIVQYDPVYPYISNYLEKAYKNIA